MSVEAPVVVGSLVALEKAKLDASKRVAILANAAKIKGKEFIKKRSEILDKLFKSESKYAERTYYFWTVFASLSFVLAGSFLYDYDIGHSSDVHVRRIFLAQLIVHAIQCLVALVLHFYPIAKTNKDECLSNYRLSILGMFIVNIIIGVFDIVSIIIQFDDSRVKNALLTYMTSMTITIPMMAHISMKHLLTKYLKGDYSGCDNYV